MLSENEIKEMLLDIINNGAEYECRHKREVATYFWEPDRYEYTEWVPYRLGEAIYEDWEYRKCEVWYVISYLDWSYKIHNIKNKNDRIVFQGSKEQCEKWIKEQTKKTWLEEYLYNVQSRSLYGGDNHKEGIEAVCRKILEEADKTSYSTGIQYVGKIIRDLGVKI